MRIQRIAFSGHIVKSILCLNGIIAVSGYFFLPYITVEIRHVLLETDGQVIGAVRLEFIVSIPRDYDWSRLIHDIFGNCFVASESCMEIFDIKCIFFDCGSQGIPTGIFIQRSQLPFRHITVPGIKVVNPAKCSVYHIPEFVIELGCVNFYRRGIGIHCLYLFSSSIKPPAPGLPPDIQLRNFSPVIGCSRPHKSLIRSCFFSHLMETLRIEIDGPVSNIMLIVIPLFLIFFQISFILFFTNPDLFVVWICFCRLLPLPFFNRHIAVIIINFLRGKVILRIDIGKCIVCKDNWFFECIRIFL